MNKNAGIVLEFNGHQYDLQKLMAIAKTCPKVELKGLKLNDESHPNASEHAVTIIPADSIVEDPTVVIFKQHGNYTVLMGREMLAGGSAGMNALKAHLISTPALKKVRIEKHEPASVEQVVASTATGVMADKMQQAFTQPATIKPYQRESVDLNTDRFDAPVVRRQDNETTKTQNSNLSGAYAHPGASTGHSTLTRQAREQSNGFSVPGETPYEKYKKEYFAANPNEKPPEKKAATSTGFKVQNSNISGRNETLVSHHAQQVQQVQQHPDTHRPRAHQFGALQRKKI